MLIVGDDDTSLQWHTFNPPQIADLSTAEKGTSLCRK